MAYVRKLPKKPSKLIRLALDDLNKIERTKAYKVDMGTWHEIYAGDEQCSVCLAGAVMAKTLNVHVEDDRAPYHFAEDNEARLESLDSFRLGMVSEAFTFLGLDWETGESLDREIPIYSRDRKGFKLAMRKLANDLEAKGF